MQCDVRVLNGQLNLNGNLLFEYLNDYLRSDSVQLL